MDILKDKHIFISSQTKILFLECFAGYKSLNQELASTHAFFAKHGINCFYLTASAQAYHTSLTFRQSLEEINPEFIFINTDYSNISQAQEQARRIKEFLKTAKIIGLCGNSKHKYSFEYFEAFIEGLPEDSSLLFMLMHKGYGISRSDIPGLIIESEKKIVINSQKQSRLNPDIYPSPMPFLQQGLKSVVYFSSRTCQEKKFYFSAGRVSEDIFRLAQESKAVNIIIEDPGFMENIERFIEICRQLNKVQEKKFRISCFGSFAFFRSGEEAVRMLKKAGIAMVFLNIYSCNEKIRKNFGLNISDKEIRSVIRTLSESKILSHAIFVSGLPESIWAEELSFAKKLIKIGKGFFEAYSAFLTPEQKNIYTEKPEKYALIFSEKECINPSNTPYYTLKHSNYKEMISLKNQFDTAVYKYFLKNLEKQPYTSVLFMLELKKKYNLSLLSIPVILNSLTALKNYFSFLQHERFSDFTNLNSDLSDWIALRTLKEMQYIKTEKGITLYGGLKKILLPLGVESELFEYASGKLNIKDTAQKLSRNYGMDPNIFIEKTMLPFYKKLAENFYIVFYK